MYDFEKAGEQIKGYTFLKKLIIFIKPLYIMGLGESINSYY